MKSGLLSIAFVLFSCSSRNELYIIFDNSDRNHNVNLEVRVDSEIKHFVQLHRFTVDGKAPRTVTRQYLIDKDRAVIELHDRKNQLYSQTNISFENKNKLWLVAIVEPDTLNGLLLNSVLKDEPLIIQ